MSKLREHLEAAREVHRATRYPGDLVADVRARQLRTAGGTTRADGGVSRWLIGAGLVAAAGAAVAACVAIAVWTGGSFTRSTGGPIAGTDGTSNANPVAPGKVPSTSPGNAAPSEGSPGSVLAVFQAAPDSLDTEGVTWSFTPPAAIASATAADAAQLATTTSGNDEPAATVTDAVAVAPMNDLGGLTPSFDLSAPVSSSSNDEQSTRSNATD